jgi:hypothetical protein
VRNKYPSKYSNGKDVSAAQYIAEMICERLAKRNKKDLHYRFWLSEEWEKEYKGQIAAANKLLKTYSFTEIVHALNSSYGLKIYSLRAPHLVGIIEKTKASAPKAPTGQNKNIERNLLDKGKDNSVKLSILDKLKELDNGFTR